MDIWLLALVNAVRKFLYNFLLLIPGMDHPNLIRKENILSWLMLIVFVIFLFWLTISYS